MRHMRRIITKTFLPTLLICFCFSLLLSSTVQAANKSTYKKKAVTVATCKLKKSASSDSKTICKIKKYESFTAIKKGKNGWVKVKYNKKTGYVKENSIVVGSNAKRLLKKIKKASQVKLGTFKITAYCWTGNRTASGVYPKSHRTIAVDPKVIPLGTKIIINGKAYIAEDTGVRNRTIDIYMSSRSAAINWGVRYLTVYQQVDPTVDVML